MTEHEQLLAFQQDVQNLTARYLDEFDIDPWDMMCILMAHTLSFLEEVARSEQRAEDNEGCSTPT